MIVGNFSLLFLACPKIPSWICCHGMYVSLHSQMIWVICYPSLVLLAFWVAGDLQSNTDTHQLEHSMIIISKKTEFHDFGPRCSSIFAALHRRNKTQWDQFRTCSCIQHENDRSIKCGMNSSLSHSDFSENAKRNFGMIHMQMTNDWCRKGLGEFWCSGICERRLCQTGLSRRKAVATNA